MLAEDRHAARTEEHVDRVKRGVYQGSANRNISGLVIFCFSFNRDFFSILQFLWLFNVNLKLSSLAFAKRPKGGLPTRQEQLAALKRDHFDVLVIGGGATGQVPFSATIQP